jgi:hypothetical protein
MEGKWTSADLPVVIIGQVLGPPGCSNARFSVTSSCRRVEMDPIQYLYYATSELIVRVGLYMFLFI